ncbi:MAG: MFS transporter [Phycisphaerae bacterium]|nr:MFS transporter [Phycisphaerae bacterium]
MTESAPAERPSQTPPHATWRAAIRGNVLMMGLVSLLTDFSSEMMNPLLPVFLAGLVPLGWAPFYVGLMEGVAETAASLLKLVSGRMSDAWGRRKALVVVGYGLSAVFRPMMALAAAGWHVVAMKLADRVGKGIRTSPRDALISQAAAPQFRGLAFGFHRAMDHLGAILGPLAAIAILYAFLGGGLFEHTGWFGKAGGQTGARTIHALRWLFAIALIPGLAAMVVLVGKVREMVPAPAAGEASGGVKGWRDLPRGFYAFVGIVILFALGNSSDLFIMLYGWERVGLSVMDLIGLWIALHLAKVAFSFPGGALSDRLGRRPLIVAGWAVYALVYLGLAAVGQAWQLWGLVVAYGVYYGLTEGAEKALVADFVPAQQRGTAFGIYHAAVGVSALPASLMFGVFWSTIGPVVAFGIGAALAGAAAVLLIVLLSTARGRQQA